MLDIQVCSGCGMALAGCICPEFQKRLSLAELQAAHPNRPRLDPYVVDLEVLLIALVATLATNTAAKEADEKKIAAEREAHEATRKQLEEADKALIEAFPGHILSEFLNDSEYSEAAKAPYKAALARQQARDKEGK